MSCIPTSVPTARHHRPAARRLAAALAVGLAAAAARADAPDPAADPVVAARLEWHRQVAAQKAAEDERDAIGPVPPAGPATKLGSRDDPGQLLKGLAEHLTAPAADRGREYADLADAAQARAKAAEADWAGVYRGRVGFQAHVDQAERRCGFRFGSPDQVEPPRFRPTPLDYALLGWGGLMLVVGLRLAGHEFRVDRRRWRRSRVAVAALAVLGPAAGGCSDRPADDRPWADRERDRLAREATAAAAAADAARREADDNWKRALEQWSGLLAADGRHRAAAQQLDKGFQEAEEAARADLRRLLAATALADRLTGEAAREREELPKDRDRLEKLIADSRGYNAAFAAARLAAGVLVVGLAAAPLVWARRRRARRLAAEARVCPRCLAGGRLERRKADAADPRYPEARYLECKECGYRFRSSYAKLPRLCFPTVGYRSSGKTQLLVTAYDRVRNGLAPTDAAVQRAPSLADEEFEVYIDLILRSHQQVGPTMYGSLPNPINLHVRDADPAGASTVLVNLFDYAGEMMTTTVDQDALRQRAVLMDGFLLFLDPTQLYGDTVHLPNGDTISNARLEEQIKALNDFYEDMREIRGVDVGRVIPVPIAVCVPKIDLLVTENPIGGASVPYIHRLVGDDLNADGPATLDVIARRSAIIEEMFPMMFPGLNLKKRLRDYFGDRVMFFPVSSVGLVEEELGVRDLSARTIAPYGVVEPVLWLLHMHGYQVFAE